MIDATIIRAHQHAAGAVGGQEKQDLGCSCGGFSTKIHAKVDSLGLPLEVCLSPGQNSDINMAEKLVASEFCEYLLADKGYDSNEFREMITQLGATPVIPGKKNRIEPIQYDTVIYQERNIVERFFNRIKQFRRIATRYDKTSIMYLGALMLVCIWLWLK